MSIQISRYRRNGWRNDSLVWIALTAGLGPLAGAQAPPAYAPTTLPIKQITLYTSGVAYTERAGMVDGTTAVPLTFHTGEINDILKSMVLLDHGGKVQPATYASKDPITRTLQGFAVDVSEQLSESDLLGKLRGSKVLVESPGKPVISGQIMGVEGSQDTRDDKVPINDTYLSLLTDSGITSIKLGQEQTVRILDDRLNSELHEALTTLAGTTDNERRQVMLHFAGSGRRDVHVAYVTEAPIWKISYRLVLGSPARKTTATKPYLQGWAIVENTSDEDWNGIRLSLVSGRPVSFIQDLYQPLYIPRPVVGPDVVGSPYPQTHDENLLADRRSSIAPTRIRASGASVVTQEPELDGERSAKRDGSEDINTKVDLDLSSANLYYGIKQLFSNVRANFTIDESLKAYTVTIHLRQVPFRLALETLLKSSSVPLTYKVENGIYSIVPKVEEAAPEAEDNGRLGPGGPGLRGQMRASVRAGAAGQRTGEMFAYNITSPVSLPRRQAAMIPVIAQDIIADRISIYNADLDGQFPMNAIRIRNSTSLHLKGGPVTLFDGGAYAGDSRMEDVPPGDTRILSYAVDIGVLCNRSVSAATVKTSISIHRGVMTETQRVNETTNYTLKSRLKVPRTVFVEHPYEAGIHLVAPQKPTERTPSVYRFATSLPAGKSQTLKVVTMRDISSKITILSLSKDQVFEYIKGGDISAKLKAEMHEIFRRRKQIDEFKTHAGTISEEVVTINDDQGRIRKNRAALDHTSELYKRYVSELDVQETRIGKIRREAADLYHRATAAETALRSYIDGLTE